MSRRLDDLDPDLRPRVFELLARLTEQGLHVLIVDTLRTPAEHQHNLANGTSWTVRSKHLPNWRGKSEAIDLAIYAEWRLHGPDKLQWNPDEPAWQELGLMGERLGLRWGGRWKKRDLGHFELIHPTPRPK